MAEQPQETGDYTEKGEEARSEIAGLEQSRRHDAKEKTG